MLISNNSTLINQLKISLVFNNNNDKFTKNIIIKTNDIIDTSYNKDGKKLFVKGKIKEIGVTFDKSSLGRIEYYTYILIDGSDEFFGKQFYITPKMILDLNIHETSESIINPVLSVDNEEQRVLMVRENELGIFQYSKDGLTWNGAGEGEPGLSAYEVAVKLGFIGTEQEWLLSLKSTDKLETSDMIVDDWTHQTRYKKGNIVWVENSAKRCNVKHTSGALFINDINKWDDLVSAPTLKETSGSITIGPEDNVFLHLPTGYNKYDIRSIYASSVIEENIAIEIYNKTESGLILYKSLETTTIQDIVNMPCEDKDMTKCIHVKIFNKGTVETNINYLIYITSLN